MQIIRLLCIKRYFMLSKSAEKLIKSLKVKKYRHNHGLYIAEGAKVVEEIISSGIKPKYLLVTEKESAKFQDATLVDEKTLNDLSQFATPSGVLAVFEIKELKPFKPEEITLLLDSINDPGNLGTIIRTADWFGIKNIICSEGTVDLYNAKTIQSTMGSINRVNIYYQNLEEIIQKFKSDVKVYATVLNGKNLEKVKIQKPAFILVGSESHGISKSLISISHEKITIPKIGEVESLNAAVATSIICWHFSVFGR